MTDDTNLQNLLSFLNASIELQPGLAVGPESEKTDVSNSSTPSSRAVSEPSSAVQPMQSQNEV
jgi:hypothetical protein